MGHLHPTNLQPMGMFLSRVDVGIPISVFQKIPASLFSPSLGPPTALLHGSDQSHTGSHLLVTFSQAGLSQTSKG